MSNPPTQLDDLIPNDPTPEDHGAGPEDTNSPPATPDEILARAQKSLEGIDRDELARVAAEIRAEDGSTEDGSTEDGSTEDGSTEDGSTEDGSTEDDPDAGDHFSRAYVEKLRKSEEKYRKRARDRDDLAARLHTALVEADGRLADPSVIPFHEDHITDAAALDRAITEAIERNPRLSSRAVAGDVGAGSRGTASTGDVDLISLMRGL